MEEKNFDQICKVIKIQEEYPHYTGSEKWLIMSDLSEEEMILRFPEKMELYFPYLILTNEMGEVIKTFQRNERKHQRRAERRADAFGYGDGMTEVNHHETWNKSGEMVFFEQIGLKERTEELTKALQLLTKVQRERILMYYCMKMTESDIAIAVNAGRTSVQESIITGMKKLRKFYQNKKILTNYELS